MSINLVKTSSFETMGDMTYHTKAYGKYFIQQEEPRLHGKMPVQSSYLLQPLCPRRLAEELGLWVNSRDNNTTDQEIGF